MKISKLITLLCLTSAPTCNALSPINAPFIYQSAVPVAIQSSGSMANNGALSGLTAMASTYPAIYLFFAANTICTVGTGGNTAGFYYAQMSSTSAGTVFNNTLVTGSRPIKITSPTAFACTGPGAYTQSTTLQNLVTFTIPGGFLGAGGGAQIYNLWSINTSVSTKTLNITFGGSTVQTSALTTFNAYDNLFWIINTGQQDRQVAAPNSITAFGGYATANAFYSVDTSTNFSIIANGTLAADTDYIVLESMVIWAQPQGS